MAPIRMRLLRDTTGRFFGLAGAGFNPSAFGITPASEFEVVYTFPGGVEPTGRLLLTCNDMFYGATAGG